MKYLSICSGIEAATVAWQPLGWEPLGFAEIDRHASSILAHHYPTVPNYGDFTTIDPRPFRGKTDIVIGGTPCQGFSLQGLRGGLSDDRSRLALKFIELVAAILPRWFIWENVPGVFSSNAGSDFASFLGGLSGRAIPIPGRGWRNAGFVEGIPNAYGLAWRVLDSRHFNIPQRRERVFLIGHLGADWRPSGTVLFERPGRDGDFAPQPQAKPVRSSVLDSALIAFRGKKSIDSVQFGLAPTLTAMGHRDSWANSGRNIAVASPDFARWIIPVEAERCMGFPDNYTAFSGGAKLPDGPRYKMLGNSITPPVLRWLGERIQLFEEGKP